jgi:hypothetical protein
MGRRRRGIEILVNLHQAIQYNRISTLGWSCDKWPGRRRQREEKWRIDGGERGKVRLDSGTCLTETF